MAFNWSNIIIDNLTQSEMLKEQCGTYCLQQLVDQQYSAMANIYDKFHGYLIGLIAFFIIYAVLEKFITASEKGYWRINYIIGKKDIPFTPKEDTIKTIKWIKNLLFGIMFALALVYYFVYGRLLALGY